MKILVVTLSNLGDVILTLPVFQSLLNQYPAAVLDVIAGESGKIVFENDPRVRRVTVYDKKMRLNDKWRFLKSVRNEQYEVIVDLRYSAIGFFGGAKKRNSYLRSPSRRGHRGLRHLQSLRGIAGTGPVTSLGSWLEARVPHEPLQAEAKRVIVCAPGSKSDLKKWPAERYANVLSRLAEEKDCEIVLVGDKSEQADAQTIKKLMRAPVRDVTGRTDFSQLVSEIRRASLVVTNDSAPLHIADALRVPSVALFGPSDPKKYGPRLSGSVAVSKGLFCQPCEKSQCRYGHRDCLNGLDEQEVHSAAERALEGRTRSGHYRVLVIRLDRIGDLMLSVPALEALRRRFPDAHLSVLTRSSTRSLLAGHPAVDDVIAYEYEKGGRHAFPLGFFRLLEELSRRRFDAAVVLHPGIRSYLIPALAGIPVRVGYQNKHAWLLTRAVADERRFGLKHESQYALDVVSALTGVHDLIKPAEKWEPFANGGVSRERWIALHPGASCASKRWPKERFRELAETLSKEFAEYHLAIIGGTETREDARSIAEGMSPLVQDFSGRHGLRQTAEFLSKCDILISNDSGPVHIAAAAGTRVVSIFGRNQAGLSPQRWRPLGEGHAVIQKDVGCQVCLAHECPIGFECLKAISVDEVLVEVRKILTKPITVS